MALPLLMTVFFGSLLLVTVLAITWIDVRSLRIPNALVLVLLGGGFAQVLSSDSASLTARMITAAAVFCLLYMLRELYWRRTGKIGLGLGDVKMAGAAIVWINPLHAPLLVAIASGSGLIALLAVRLSKTAQVDLSYKLPFGPFLGLALASVWSMEAISILETGL